MGSYLNPGNKGFQESLNSEIYVDKTGLIEKTNAVLDTRQKFLCVSRQDVLENQWQQICLLLIMSVGKMQIYCFVR